MLVDDVRCLLRLFKSDDWPTVGARQFDRWLALTTGLTRLHDEVDVPPTSIEVDELIEEIETALAGWPDELRFASYDSISRRPGFPSHAASWTGRLVRTLSIDSTGLDGDAMRSLFAAWPNLTQITFDEVMIEDDGFGVLFDPPVQSLSALHFIRCALDDDVVARLVASPLSRRLRRLGLLEDIADEMLARLLGALPEITGLDLDSIGPTAAHALAHSGAPTTLRDLELGQGACRAEVLQVLASVSWRGLDRLKLAADGYPRATTREGDPGWLDVLLGSSLLTQAREIDLGDAKIGTEGVDALASADLSRLEVLRLLRLTNRGASALAAAPFMAHLKRLVVVAGDLDAARVATLERAMPVGELDLGAA